MVAKGVNVADTGFPRVAVTKGHEYLSRFGACEVDALQGLVRAQMTRAVLAIPSTDWPLTAEPRTPCNRQSSFTATTAASFADQWLRKAAFSSSPTQVPKTQST